MKRVVWLVCVLLVLTGCEMGNEPLEQAVAFRERLLSSQSCSFRTEVTADYGDLIHRFSMDCSGDASGNLEFEILQPEGIAGIRGKISDQGGSIEFEDQALFFPLMTDDLLTPASAPWIFLKTLRSGYITSACEEDGLLRITVDDGYEEDSLTLDIRLEKNQPVQADILHKGKRILALTVENFSIS